MAPPLTDRLEFPHFSNIRTASATACLSHWSLLRISAPIQTTFLLFFFPSLCETKNFLTSFQSGKATSHPLTTIINFIRCFVIRQNNVATPPPVAMANSTSSALLLFLCVFVAIASTSHGDMKTLSVSRETFLWHDHSGCTPPSISMPTSGTAEAHFLLNPKYGKCSPYRTPYNSTWRDSVWQAIAHDAKRYRHITSKFTSATISQSDVDVPLGPSEGGSASNYVIQASLGTPPQNFVGDVDTGSDVVWITCADCTDCRASSDVSPFDTSKSSTAKSIGCDDQQCTLLSQQESSCGSDNTCTFAVSYGDETSVSGPLISDTLKLASATAPSFAFGCANDESAPNTSPPAGIVGLGRGALSLVSQTANQFDKKFSYCLPSYSSSGLSGRLTLGATSSAIKATPLLSNSAGPSFYYVGLTGISVGGSPVNIPEGALTLDETTGGGTIIDSGTVISRLVDEAYTPFRDTFKQKALQSGLQEASGSSDFLNTCFQIPSNGANIPTVTFHFEGGVDLDLTQEQTLIPDQESGDGSVSCLAFATLPASSGIKNSIFGNYQQQDMLVAYDVADSKLSFSPQKCS